MLYDRSPYSLVVFVPGVHRVGELKQVHLESYTTYDDAKEDCIRYNKDNEGVEAVVIDYSGNIAFPYLLPKKFYERSI